MVYDIENSKAHNLLLATPFTGESEGNFSKNLTEDVFFNNNIYAPVVLGGVEEEIIESNLSFDKDMQTELESLDNIHSRVKLIHIKGYAGSGKTTYVHHLVWDLQKEKALSLSFLDFEGEHKAEVPIYEELLKKIRGIDIDVLKEYLEELISDHTLNNSSLFSVEDGIKVFLECLKEPRIYTDCTDVSIKQCFRQMEVIMDADDYLFFLLVLNYLLALLTRFLNTDSNPVVIVIDNIDSMEPPSEEGRLINAMKKFISMFYSFIRDNIKQDTLFHGRKTGEIIFSSKFLFFFTTRIVTARLYRDFLFRDDELEGRWKTIELPDQYYSHREIIQRKIDFYRSLGESSDKWNAKIATLCDIKKFAEVVYTNQLFKKLFNGNIRHCVNTLSYFALKEEVRDDFLCYKAKEKIPPEGITGMVINTLFTYFKERGLYSRKLNLGTCSKDGRVTCSRLVLTIIKENEKRCSMERIFKLLTPVFSVSEICDTVFNLSEEGRLEWRRLITFDIIFPQTARDLENQGQLYFSGNYDSDSFTDLVLCKAGETYLESVIPHFEFMLSRHDRERGRRKNILKVPLFIGWKGDDGEILIEDIKLKIRIVYTNVRDCIYNCKCFNDRIIAERLATTTGYLGSEYNYKNERTNAGKQSYEARLIFGHISYIERFRKYLYTEYQDENTRLKINRTIVRYIRKYLNLYRDLDSYLHNPAQDIAHEMLSNLTEIIETAKYEEYKTWIEL